MNARAHPGPRTLPLFGEVEPACVQPDEHLVAAAKLSQMIRRVPDRSSAQVRIGRLLCRHLIAMLKQTEAESNPSSRRTGTNRIPS